MAIPVISSLSKSNVVYGELITINGSDLLLAEINISGQVVYANSRTFSELTFLVPINLDLGTNELFVTNDDGDSNIVEIKVGISPVILTVSPDRLISGEEIHIYGEFLDSSIVTFDSESMILTENTDSSIRFLSPTRVPGKYTIIVLNDFGESTTSVEIGEVPVINSSDKSSVTYNEIVTFDVDNFIGSSKLFINGITFPVIYRDSIQISAMTPKINYGTYDVTAENGFGTSLPFSLTIEEGIPYISSITPKKGAQSSTIIIDGFNFINADVSFDSMMVIPDYLDNERIEILVPNLAVNTYEIELSNTFGSATGNFDIIDTPEIDSICGKLYDVGDIMIIDGYNFLTGSTNVSVLFDSFVVEQSQLLSITDTEIKLTVPYLEYDKYAVTVVKDGSSSNIENVIVGQYSESDDGSSLYDGCKSSSQIIIEDASNSIYTKPNVYDDYIYVIKIINENVDISSGGELEIDGFQLESGDIVALNSQTNEIENGIYKVNINTWEFIMSLDGLYIDSGVRAFDANDGDLTRCIVVDDCDIDFSNAGIYEVCYYVINTSNIISKVCRKIKIMFDGASLLPTHKLRISDYEISSEFNTQVINDLIHTNKNK
jgi:hypothetical protein